MAAKIRDRDRGYAALMNRLAQPKAIVTVGIHEAEGAADHGEDGATVAEIGAFHEFGTTTIPRRSFIRDWADENEEKHKDDLRKIGRAILDGKLKSTEQGLERFGALAKGEVQTRIADGIAPALAESTVETKGSSVPLIDTGVLRSSIEYRVERER